MADGTDNGLRPAEELLSMAPNARRVLRIVGDILEGGIARPNLVPICRRELVARVASLFVLRRVVREL